MLLAVLLQSAAAAGLGKLGAALGAAIAVSVQVSVSVKSVVLPWRQLPVSRSRQEISV